MVFRGTSGPAMGARVAVLLAVMLVGSTAAFGDLLGPRADEEPAAVDPAQNFKKDSEAAKKHGEEIT